MCNNVLYDVAVDACKFNLPGLTQMKYTLAKWIDTFPALEDYDGDAADPKTANPLTLSAAITLDTTTFPEAKWFSCDIEVDENSISTEYQGKPGSGYYGTTVEAFAATSDRLAHWALHKVNKSDVVVAVLDRNEEWRIIGRPKNPAQLRASFNSGKATPDKPGFTLAGEWTAHAEPPPFYDGTF